MSWDVSKQTDECIHMYEIYETLSKRRHAKIQTEGKGIIMNELKLVNKDKNNKIL